jgi:hypothetical protein
MISFKEYSVISENKDFEQKTHDRRKAAFDKQMYADLHNMVSKDKDTNIGLHAYHIKRQYRTDSSASDIEKKYRSMHEDAPAMNTSAVPGAGDDSSTVIVKKKKKITDPDTLNTGAIVRRALPI